MQKKIEKKLKVVTITGGNGGFSLLRGLKKFDWDLEAIVPMTDDGGSTGRLRRELGVLPPGDVRYCLSAMSNLPGDWEKVLNYRFESGGLKGHTIGNLMLASLEKFKGDFIEAVKEMEKLLSVKGKIIPSSLNNTQLKARLGNKKILSGQHLINTSPLIEKFGIKKIFISPRPKVNPRAVKAIMTADIVSIGPGNFYCSILPNLAIPEINEAIKKTKALVVFNCNLVNRVDQTIGFDLDDYVSLVHRYLKYDRINVATVNKTLPIGCCSYDLVTFKPEKNPQRKYKVYRFDLVDKEASKFSSSDEIAYLRSPFRHDGEKVGKALIKIFKQFK